MSNNILVVAEVNIHDGQLDNLKALVTEIVDDIQRNEPGTLDYEYFIVDDGKSGHIYERYADSEAFLAHLGIYGQKYAQRVAACLTATKLTIYGHPSDTIRGIFANYPTTYLSPLGGVAR